MGPVPVFILIIFAGILATPAAWAQDRVAVPISQTQLPDGDIRYSVPVTIGSAGPVQALLDTGSTGLRLLGGAVDSGNYRDTGFSSVYTYGSGERLGGTIGMAGIGIGGATTGTPIPIELVSTIGCMAFQPSCAAARLSLNDYGIGGDGLAGQGFRAILGISLQPATGAGYTDNPLPHTGARRWIVQLPEPGDAAPGVLILNPNDVELQGYQLFRLAAIAGSPGQDAGWQDALPACLKDASTDQKLCGPALLDTGAPGIIAYLRGANEMPLWSPGDDTALQFSTGGGGSLTIPFAADRIFGSGLVQAPANGGPAMVAGVLPFFAYSVLYDDADGLIGLKPRADAPDFHAAPANAAPDTEIEVIRMNTPGTPAAPTALPQVITPTP